MKQLIIPEITDLDIAFSTGIHTPKAEEIPKEFWNLNDPWSKLASKFFFEGANLKYYRVKDRVDLNKNIRFLKHCLSTWATKHEHKTAACAWILSETFVSPEPIRGV